ncbi:MAG: glycerate kinase [Arcobacter sp.]|nr:MAG: glycerate kinase [Arcobacter sp.]
MTIVIAPDSYKESLSAIEVAKSIKNGFKSIFPEATYILSPLGDGGEGTVSSMIYSMNGTLVKTRVQNALGENIDSFYGLINNNNTAVIEMAAASGLEHIKEEKRNIMKSSTYGFGELILHAIHKGVKHLILCLGGSATNDAGIGMLQALGVKFYDKNKLEIKSDASNISKIIAFDASALDKTFKNITIEVACDVQNPLCGEQGASYIFAKQKGASVEEIKILDSSLESFAILCARTFKIDYSKYKGAGAAGGLGFALLSFLEAPLVSGIDLVLENLNLEDKIKNASLLITGEGKIDKQTLEGKTIMGLAKLSSKHKIKTIVIAGCLGEGYELILKKGIDIVFDCTPINSSFSLLKQNAKYNLEQTSNSIAKCLKMNLD